MDNAICVVIISCFSVFKRFFMFSDSKFIEQFLDNLFEAVYFVDTSRQIMHWNKAAENLTGWKKEEIIGHRCMDNILVHIDSEGNNLCTGNCPLIQSMKSRSLHQSDIYLHHKDGHRIPVHVRIIPLFSESGESTGAIEIFSNTSADNDLMGQIDELRKLSMIDALTGISNRRYGEKIILDRIDEKNRFGWDTGIIFFDIDNFKYFNDSFSHNTGDRVLKMVSNTLRESIRSFDHVSRWGGEEFIVVLSNVTIEQLKEKAELLRRLTSESFFFEKEIRLFATISGGATMIRADDTVETVVERADHLMYQSKRSGKNKVTAG